MDFIEASEVEGCINSDDIGDDRQWGPGLRGHATLYDGCQDATKWNTSPIQLRHSILSDVEQSDL